MKSLEQIIIRPLITEKAVLGRAFARYYFEVARDASKPAIREAVEKFFKVKVEEVRTIKIPGKKRRYGRQLGMKPPSKKAIVTLREGQKIEILEAE
ncbi:MAG: 50S ribosomal protein L23 [Deltaproteobacteria bacterium]|nr:50S ribosomal protein L23 [Deltaproteobacteria bacterium]MBI2500317.1 50S ribosomal protein L23 [Deltaproteobacteria bacterium]MBI4196477.1 50S ribosomal protein L23 [Deltaproteobacteria bacterium]